MTNPQVLIFGSFTEDETRLFQKKSVENQVNPSESTMLQFGSLDSASLSSVNGLATDSGKTASSVGSKDVQSLNLVRKDTTFRNGKASDSGRTDSSVRSKDIPSPNLITKEPTPWNGKTPICHSLQKVEHVRPTAIANGCSSVDGAAGNETDSLDLNLMRISESKTDHVNLLSSKKVYDDELESLKENNKFCSSSELVTTVVCDVKRTSVQAPSARSLLPRGLINLGNLCFLNATLQALLSCSPFVGLLQDLANRNMSKIGYPTLLAFVEFISEFRMPHDSSLKKDEKGIIETGMPFSPIMFDPVLKIFTPDVPSSLKGRPRQEDAQEFLSFVMDQMHDELLKLEGHSSSSNGGSLPLVSSSGDDGWETVGPKNKSALTRTQSFIPSELSAIFGGQLRSVVKARGNKDSATVQPFLLLHIDILPEAVHTIEDALHLFSATETVEYKTSAGEAGVVSASKSVKIQTLSKILILHLMRFSYGNRGSKKLHKPVRFPLELVLPRGLLVTPSSERRKYELVATITHHGQEPSKGHYTTHTKHDGQWLRYDDSSVMAVATNRVLHDQAYVLFYRQL